MNLAATPIPYTLKRYKRSRNLRLRVRANGEVLVTAPIRTSASQIDQFVSAHHEWISLQFQKLESLPVPHIKTSKDDYKKFKELARRLVDEKIAKFNAHYRFAFGKISIRDQRSRWGSCSARKNLSFNYRIALIPEILAEYIVVHELCHLKEMNHGPRFWKLVEETVPDYRHKQAELRKLRI